MEESLSNLRVRFRAIPSCACLRAFLRGRRVFYGLVSLSASFPPPTLPTPPPRRARPPLRRLRRPRSAEQSRSRPNGNDRESCRSVRPSSGSLACQSAAGGPVPATVACAMSGNFEVTWAIKGSTLRGTRESEPNCLFQNERIFPLCFQAESDRGERGRRRLERPAFAVCSLDGAAGNVDKKCSLLSEGGRADSVQSERETIGARTDDGSSILLGQSDLRRRAKKGRRTLSLPNFEQIGTERGNQVVESKYSSGGKFIL